MQAGSCKPTLTHQSKMPTLIPGNPGPSFAQQISTLKYGAPGEIRTPDPLVRSQMLYPAELRAHSMTQNPSPLHLTSPNRRIRSVFGKRYATRRLNRLGRRNVFRLLNHGHRLHDIQPRTPQQLMNSPPPSTGWHRIPRGPSSPPRQTPSAAPHTHHEPWKAQARPRSAELASIAVHHIKLRHISIFILTACPGSP